MRKSRFSEQQIIAVLREQEVGATTSDVCRRHGVSEQTFYRWKAKYGGMGGEPLSAIGPRTMASAERALRGAALGRKAWLFAGSERDGERAAFMYSLIVTAKLNDVDPQARLGLYPCTPARPQDH